MFYYSSLLVLSFIEKLQTNKLAKLCQNSVGIKSLEKSLVFFNKKN